MATCQVVFHVSSCIFPSITFSSRYIYLSLRLYQFPNLLSLFSFPFSLSLSLSLSLGTSAPKDFTFHPIASSISDLHESLRFPFSTAFRFKFILLFIWLVETSVDC
ncbi:hypothetical protein Lal_00006763 [Lupinus albus]|nr:hypothetical protein Lal_00006763 [Lupinus albus]